VAEGQRERGRTELDYPLCYILVSSLWYQSIGTQRWLDVRIWCLP
jgi:hypothetical protein